MVLLLLAGCASGNAQEARRGQEQDAAEAPTLPEQQATFTARRYFPLTPTPSPTQPPAPTLASLVLSLNAGGEPADEYNAVPNNAGTAYASALIHGLNPGQVVSASWTNAAGAVVSTSAYDVAAPGEQWVPLPLYLDGGLTPGDYAVYVFADERPLNSLVFRLLPAGSAPQRLDDLPPADRIRIQQGGPGQSPTPTGDQWNQNQNQGQIQDPWNPDSNNPQNVQWTDQGMWPDQGQDPAGNPQPAPDQTWVDPQDGTWDQAAGDGAPIQPVATWAP